VVAYINKKHIIVAGIQKFKENPISSMHGKAAKPLELAVQTVRSEALMEWIAAKEHNLRLGGPLDLWVEALVAASEPLGVVDSHNRRKEVSLGSFPARCSCLASWDHRSTSCSVTALSARAIRAPSSFFGITTRSSLPASFLGMVIVAIWSEYIMYQ